MDGADIKRGVLAGAGRVAALVPSDRAQLFGFVASPAVRANPWALYQRLHARGPIRPTGYAGTWLVASHAGVNQMLRSQNVSVDEAQAFPNADRSGPFSALIGQSMLFRDPPDHTRLRRLVARAFTPRTVELLRPRVETLVDAHLTRLQPAGSCDLIADFALPLPVSVICELLGVPEIERTRFLRWAQHLAPRLDIDLFRDAERNRAGDLAAAELTTFLHELVADPQRRDPDGLLNQLVDLEDDGDRLTRDEIVSMAALLLVAGFETTTNLIGNSIVALAAAPGELERLRSGEATPSVAVDELLRYAGPVQFAQRILLEDTEIVGHDLPAKTLVALMVGAANRDPHVFANPDALDLLRAPNPHISFSAGIHHCLGAALARLEAEIAIPAIIRSLPNLQLTGPPRWRNTFVLRGLVGLPATWSPN